MAPEQTVFVIEDDEAVRGVLVALLGSAGLATMAFATADDFIAVFDPDASGCVVLDLNLPGRSGLELEAWLRERNALIPVLFLSGCGTVESAVAAMRGGALDFLQKPVDRGLLLERVREALASDTGRRRVQAEVEPIRACLAKLSPRETELIDHLLAGKSSKQIAIELRLSQKTVEHHRAHLMHKMRATNMADLTRMVLQARSTSDA